MLTSSSNVAITKGKDLQYTNYFDLRDTKLDVYEKEYEKNKIKKAYRGFMDWGTYEESSNMQKKNIFINKC